MPTLSSVFEDEKLKTKDVLEHLHGIAVPEAGAEHDRLRATLRTKWGKLQDPQAGATGEDVKKSKQWRGYQLERIVFELMWLEGLSPAAPYYHDKGRRGPPVEIDDGEAETEADAGEGAEPKRRGRPSGGEQIDGFFELNILLVDGGDLGAALRPGGSFREMMRVKLREAARVGQVYYSYKTYLDLGGRGT